MAGRTKHEIMLTILIIAKIPAYKTTLMFEANLNYKQFQRYHALLHKNGLVSQVGEKWVTTEKGHLFIDAYQKATSILSG